MKAAADIARGLCQLRIHRLRTVKRASELLLGRCALRGWVMPLCETIPIGETSQRLYPVLRISLCRYCDVRTMRGARLYSNDIAGAKTGSGMIVMGTHTSFLKLTPCPLIAY